jgi:hypothetical protein
MQAADEAKVKQAVKEAVLEALEEYFRNHKWPPTYVVDNKTDVVGKQCTPTPTK